jgi:hypothetical protein
MTDSNIRRRAVERILEDESITADLTDEAAKSLLDWGLAQVEAMVQQAAKFSRDELQARLAVLRRTMKRIGREAGQAAADAQVEQVQRSLARAEAERTDQGPDTTE